MMSGEFHHIEVASIKVNRDKRYRRRLTGIEELAADIDKRGLINPITLDRNNVLRAGERRLAAVKLLGRTTIACHYTDELDPLELEALELEENIKRVPLEWEEERRMVSRYHKNKCEQAKLRGEKWTQWDTARELVMDQGQVSRYLDIAERIEERDPDVLNALSEGKSCSAVTNMIKRKEEREALEARRVLDDFINGKTDQEPPSSPIINADFTKWVETYDGPKFNFLHIDFPFGIDADKMHQGNSVTTHGGYDDSEKTYKNLVEVLCRNVPRICTESAHIMFWFSMHYYQWTFDYIQDNTNFELDPFPLIWVKSDKGLLPDPQRGPRRMYETCLFGSLGDRKIVKSVANVFTWQTEHKDHMSTKPEPMLRHFFRMFVDGNTYMLDPTCGSGTALCAAEAHKAKYVQGVEINEEFAKRADLRLWEARRTRSDQSVLDEILETP